MDIDKWQRLRTLIEEASELTRSEREAYFAHISATNPDLVEELRRLVALNDANDSAMDQDVAAFVSEAVASEVSADLLPELQPGTRIGHYVILTSIGSGGMGAVYKAERRETGFTQTVALKILHDAIPSRAARQRFYQERQVLGTLRHPCIAQLLDVGETSEGQPYFTMELVEGVPITTYCTSKGLSVEQRLRLVSRVASALAYAHQKLVIHRDIKPSNILVTDDGTPKLLDFGISKLLDLPDAATPTMQHVAPMTPEYAAPEQFRGAPVTAATDIYQLATLTYRLVTCALPFDANTADLPAWSNAVCEREPDSIGRAISRQNRKLSDSTEARLLRQSVTADKDLNAILMQALTKAPEDRYRSMDAFCADIEAYLACRPISAKRASRWASAVKFVRRNRLATAAVAASVLALACGAALATWQAIEARTQARRAEHTYQFVLSLFKDMNPIRAQKERAMAADSLLREGLRRMDTDLKGMPDIRANLRATFANGLFELGHYDEAVAYLEGAVREHETLRPPAPESMASTLNDLASAYKEISRLPEAEAAALRALSIYEKLPGDHRRETINARTLLANVATNQRRTKEAIALHERILADRRALPDVRPIDLAVDYNNLGSAYLADDRYKESEHWYRQLDDLLSTDPEAPPSRRVYSLAGLGEALYGQARYDEALAAVDQMQEIGLRTLSAKHAVVVGGQSLRARIALARGEYAAADALFAEAIEQLSPASLGLAELNWGLGLLDQGRTAEATTRLEAAVRHLDATQGADGPSTLLARIALAALRMRQDPDALHQAEIAFARYAATDRLDNDEYPRAALLLAGGLDAAGRGDEARVLRQEAASTLVRLLGPAHPWAIKAQSALTTGKAESGSPAYIPFAQLQ
jgi:serine/threonine-protein kinase